MRLFVVFARGVNRLDLASSAKATTLPTTSRRSNPVLSKSAANLVCSMRRKRMRVASMSISLAGRLTCLKFQRTLVMASRMVNIPASSITNSHNNKPSSSNNSNNNRTPSRRWSTRFSHVCCASWRRLAVWLCNYYGIGQHLCSSLPCYEGSDNLRYNVTDI